MSSNTTFGFTDEEVVYILATQLHSKILDILGYGIYTTIYFVALYLTLSRGTERPRVGSAVLITIIWISVTLHVSVIWAYLDNIYIQHGETQEGQLGARFFCYKEMPQQYLMDIIVIFASLVFADMAMVWRCWVLYGRRWVCVIIPVLSLVSGAACYSWRTAIILQPLGVGIEASDLNTNLELSYLSTTVLTNIYCTTAIIYRIISVTGWRKSLKTYRRLIEILIESSVLYTAIFMIRIGLEIHTQYFTKVRDDRVLFAQALAFSITGISPTLIIARVAAGYARPDDSWTRTSLPHMGSTMRSLAESLHLAQPTTGSMTDNVDLERSIKSDVSAAVDEGDETRRKSPKLTTGGGDLKTEPGEVSKEA